MHIKLACTRIIEQLSDFVRQIDPIDFVRPSEALSGSSLGQHLRHTLEFFTCLESGCDEGTVNYDKRAHDKSIEGDKALALAALQRVGQFIDKVDPSKPIRLQVGYDLEEDMFVTLETNVLRELVYNIEHAVHHMAIMKIGVREVARYIELPKDFGVAASTVRHKEAATASAHL